jgi:hypothetical protein
LILDDVILILDCPVTVRLLTEAKSRVLYADNEIMELRLFNIPLYILVSPVVPMMSRLSPSDIETKPASFPITIAFSAFNNKSFPIAGLLDRTFVKTVEKVEVADPPPPLVGRGRPLKVTALMSPKEMVDGALRLIVFVEIFILVARRLR